jgi:hypothetical protein
MYRTLTLVFALAGSGTSVAAAQERVFRRIKLVENTEKMSRPAAYRDVHHMLGSWTVLDPKGNRNTLHTHHLGGRVLPAAQEIRRWHCVGEGGQWNQPRSDDDGKCRLGDQNQRLVCSY